MKMLRLYIYVNWHISTIIFQSVIVWIRGWLVLIFFAFFSCKLAKHPSGVVVMVGH